MADARRLPTLFESRSTPVQATLVVLVPAALGAVGGLAVSPLPALYVAVAILATIGGILAGLEHRSYGQAALRGFGAGLCYGIAVWGVHKLVGGNAHQLLGQKPVLLPAVTAVLGAVFAAIGCFIRGRLETAS